MGVVVTTVLNEWQVLAPSHHLGVNFAPVQGNGVRLAFVVESKPGPVVSELPGLCSQGKRWGSLRQRCKAWSVDVARVNAQRLRHVQRRFAVHVFVEQGQAKEVKALIVFWRHVQPFKRFLQAAGQMVPGGVHVWQIQRPARGVGHRAGVVEGVGVPAFTGLASRLTGLAGV